MTNPFRPIGDDPILLMLDNTFEVYSECLEIAKNYKDRPNITVLAMESFVKNEAPALYLKLNEKIQLDELQFGLRLLKNNLSIIERNEYWHFVCQHFAAKL